MTEPLIQILILSGITIFVLSRLYRALGKEEHRPDDAMIQLDKPSGKPAGRQQETDSLRPQPYEPVFTGPAAAGLTAIHSADSSFTTRDFLGGAKQAYEIIVGAFANGDRKTLKPLLDEDVYAAWDAEIRQRETDGRPAFKLLRLKKYDIEDAEVDEDTARITVRYEAELGDGERTRKALEMWVYKRPLGSTDPNWLLDEVIATS